MITTAEDLYGAIGHEIDLTDDRAVQELPFTEQQLPLTRSTDSGPSLDLADLKKLHAQTDNPVLGFVIDSRERR